MQKNGKMIKVKQPTMQTPDTQEELLLENMRLLDKLWEMRLVEKISRPIGKASKEVLCRDYQGKVEQLNKNLHMFRINII